MSLDFVSGMPFGFDYNELKKQFFNVFLPGMGDHVQGNVPAIISSRHCTHLKEIYGDPEKARKDWMNMVGPRSTLIGLFSIIGITGLVTNLTLIISILANRSKITASNIFLVNMALSGILLCITSIPFTPWYSISETWPFNVTWTCNILPMCQGLSIIVTANSLCCLAIQRYMHIVHASRYAVGWSTSFALTLTAFNWLFGLILHIPITITTEYQDSIQGTKLCRYYCSENWKILGYNSQQNLMHKIENCINTGGTVTKKIYSCLAVMFQFILPLFVFAYCNLRIVYVIRRDMIVGAQLADMGAREKAVRNKLRASVLLIGMVLVFIGCWSTIFIPLTLTDFDYSIIWWNGSEYHWTGFIRLFAYAIAFSSVVWNPLMYFWLSPAQRQRALEVFRIVQKSIPNSSVRFDHQTRVSEKSRLVPGSTPRHSERDNSRKSMFLHTQTHYRTMTVHLDNRSPETHSNKYELHEMMSDKASASKSAGYLVGADDPRNRISRSKSTDHPFLELQTQFTVNLIRNEPQNTEMRKVSIIDDIE